jgi:hypothetical protein
MLDPDVAIIIISHDVTGMLSGSHTQIFFALGFDGVDFATSPSHF